MLDLGNLGADFFADPYPQYQALRAQAPLLALPDGGYLVTGYELCRTIYRDTQRFSSDTQVQFEPVFGRASPLFEHHTTSLVFNDPPLHTRVRRAIGNALSQQMLVELRPSLDSVIQNLLLNLQSRPRADLIAEFAGAIPVEIIGNLLRIPAAERGPLRQWSLDILGALEINLTPERRAAGEQSVRDFVAYLAELIARRRKNLGAADSDILTRLLTWQDADGAQLTATELHHQCIFLLNAGHETTTNLIGNGIELLLRHPDSLNNLQNGNARMATAVEEMLRCESPNQLGNRTVRSDTSLADTHLAAGTVLTLCIGAANRDPETFSAAQTFDIHRNPNPHLAFGGGVHTCAGLHVARLEANLALTQLFQRFLDLSLTQTPQRAQRARFRGFERLECDLGAAA
ncbi:MAG: cytochrome P450 [Pseudomonadota bacterium]